jgi:hypothetical protein
VATADQVKMIEDAHVIAAVQQEMELRRCG